MNRRDFLKLAGGLVAGATVVPFLKPMLSTAAISPKSVQTGRQVFKPTDKPYGRTWSEWVRRWYQWCATFPTPDTGDSPFNESGGRLTMSMQPKEDVFFLTGSYLRSTERTITTNKALFFPVICSAYKLHERIEGNHSHSVTVLDTEEKLKAFTRADVDDTSSLNITLDGEGLPYYRVDSEVLFDVPTGKMFSSSPIFTDGYWVFLKPLPSGTYHLFNRGIGTNWIDDICWHEGQQYFTEAKVTIYV